MQRILFLLTLSLLSGCCAETGCNGPVDPPGTPPVASFRIWAGDGQTALAGTALPNEISVQANNYSGPATFTVRSGGGRVNGAASQSVALGGPDNVAAVVWRLGPDLGEQVVRVTFSNRNNFLDIKAVAHGQAALIQAMRGQGQTTAPGTAVAIRPTVKLTDIDSRPIPRARVEFDKDGILWGTRTDVAGLAEMPIDWIPGQALGNYVVAAYYSDGNGYPAILGNPVVFTAAVVASTATQMTKSAGDNQSAAPGSAVATLPAVRLTDQFGNGVAGIGVTFARQENAGSLADSVVTTDANGVATSGTWVLGPLGTYHLTATAVGQTMTGSPARFTATAEPPAGTPASVVIVSGDAQTGDVLSELPQTLRVRVLDAQGRPVPSLTVSFRPGTGSGSFPSSLGRPPIRTNAAGEAESYPWTLGRLAGAQYVEVSIPLGPSTIQYPVFQATATPGKVRLFTKFSGDGGSYLSGGTVPVSGLPRVQVRDQYDNPVPGVSIDFAVTGGGGSLSGSGTVVTNALGLAQPGGWVLGSTAGTNTLTATATAAPTTSITPVTLTFTTVGATATANVLVNPSFEAPVTSRFLPTFPGAWEGDAVQSVGPSGFSAKDGLKVMQFLATGGPLASTPTTASQLWQLVDVSQYGSLIDAGQVGMTGRVWFNRVGGLGSDSLFSVRIYALNGSTQDFAQRYSAQTWLARGVADLKTDGDLATWQEVVATITLPAGTRYVAIEVIGFEDVVNDGPGTPEFLGHFADGASLVLVRQ